MSAWIYQTRHYQSRLLLEAAGICRKAIEYYKELASNSYRFVPVSYSFESDEAVDYPILIKAFGEEYCEFTDNTSDRVSSAQLHALFQDFCCSLSLPPLDINTFSRHFRELFKDRTEKARARIGSENVQAFLKIRLTNNKKS